MLKPEPNPPTKSEVSGRSSGSWWSFQGSREERWNWVSHALGFVLSLVGVVVMLLVHRSESALVETSLYLFLAVLLAVYLFSTLSHYVQSPKYRLHLRKLDQAFIYLLIAATFTPFSFAFLSGLWWTSLLVIMWIIGIAGFLSKIVFAHHVDQVSVWIYLVLGWLPAMGGIPWTPQLPAAVFWCIMAGGLWYTVGTVFLINDKRVWYFHTVWHVCVIVGSGTHFVGMLVFL